MMSYDHNIKVTCTIHLQSKIEPTVCGRGSILHQHSTTSNTINISLLVKIFFIKKNLNSFKWVTIINYLTWQARRSLKFWDFMLVSLNLYPLVE
jgi:hypothetical protein